MKKKLVIIVILILSWLGYRFFFASKTGVTTYQTVKVEKGSLIVSVAVSGQVASNNSSPITTTATGVVSKIYVKNGEIVKAGQPIALLDLDQLAKSAYYQALASYQGAKNSLDNAKSGLYTSQSKLFATNQKLINDAVARGLTVDDPTYIQQNADWKAAEGSYFTQENAIKQAQTSLSSSWLDLQQKSPTIYAPISGKVTGLFLQVGTILSVTKVGSVVTDAYPTLTANLTEVDVPKVKVGDRATIIIDSLTDKTFSGKVISVDTVGAVTSGVTTYPAVIAFDTKSDQILPNMNAQANVITTVKDDVLIVPSSAVQISSGQSSVKVMSKKIPAPVNVQTGLDSGTQIEIISGLKEGDEVVIATISTAITTKASSTSPFSSIGGNFRGR